MKILTTVAHTVSRFVEAVNLRLGNKSRHLVVAMRTIMATSLAMLLSTVLAEPFSVSTSALFSSPEAKDFQMTDLFAQIADHRPVKKLEDRIVLVNIGRADRDEIAEGLSLLSLCGPRAIGVDVNFAEPHENDSALLSAIAVNPGIVLPIGLSTDENTGKFVISDKPFFYNDPALDVKYGVSNLPSKSEKSTIREYVVDYPTHNGKLDSFVSTLAGAYDPAALKKLKERGSHLGVTSYHSREFNTVDISEIEENAELFADKIVMVGALDDASDMHATPVNSYMPGLMLHAHALATVLDGIWFTKTSQAFDYIIAILVCLLITSLYFTINIRFKGITLRVIQVILAYLAVRIGYGAFIDHCMLFDFTFTLLIIAFGLFAADIWNGVEEGSRRLWKLVDNHINRKNQVTCEETYL